MIGLRCWLCGLMVALQMLALWIYVYFCLVLVLSATRILRGNPGALSVLLAGLVGAEGQP